MGSLTELTKQALGLSRIAPTRADATLLKSLGVDGLGRTLPMGFTYTGASGPQWLSFDQALGRDQYQGVVYLIIASILRKANDVPWGVFKAGQKDERAALVDGAHPLNAFMWKPNLKGQSMADIVEELGGYLLLTGNAYGFHVTPEFGSSAVRGMMKELYPLPSDRTSPIAGRKYLDPVQGYVFRENDGSQTKYDVSQVLHIKYWNPGDSAVGLSPLQAMAKMVTSADSGMSAQVRQFQNQGPAGIVYDESSLDPWTAEQSQTVRSWFRSFFPGGRQSGELPVVGGKLGYLKLGLSPTDLDVLQALQVTTRQLCSGFGFPAELLNDKEASTYNNVNEARKAAFTDAVLPLLRRIRDGLNRAIAPPDEVFFDIITDGIPELQQNRKELAEVLEKCDWISLREKQRMMGVDVEPETNKDFPKYAFRQMYVSAEQAFAAPDPAVAAIDAPPVDGEAVN